MFRLGLVGAGRMGRTHLRALAGNDEVGVVAVAEPVESLRQEVMSNFGVTAFASLEDMLDVGGLDGVLVVTPSDSHLEVITHVASRGLAILCEKPCGVTSSDTRRAAEVVHAAGVPLQVAYWRRFVPALQELRERIAAGAFGDVLTVSCLQWDGEPPSAAFRARSGGVFVDMGVHEFDQARWLTGSDVTELRAFASPAISDPDCDGDPDSAQVLAQMGSGATALVSLGRHYPGGDMASVEVFGSRDHAFSVFLDPVDGAGAQLAALGRQAEAFAQFAGGAPCRGASVADAVAALDAAERAADQVRGRTP